MKKTFFLAVVAFALMCACQKTESDDVFSPDFAPKPGQENGMHLGSRLVNAYSMENMLRAYDSYYSGGTGPERVEPTHYYVCFRYPNPTLLDIILNDTTIDAFPFPLDYELIGTGEYIPPAGQQNWVYAVVPVDWPHLMEFPVVIIDTCCIPGDRSELLPVEELSLQLTGNVSRSSESEDTTATRVSGCPAGVMRVWNTETNQYEPVRNARLKMNTLVRVRRVWTGEDGSYSCGSRFYSNVNYTLFFENKDEFQIWNNNLCFLPATLSMGIHSPTGYSYNMSPSSYGWRLSTINNATHIYKTTICSHFGFDNPVRGLRISMITLNDLGWGGSTPMWRRRNTGGAEISNFSQFLAVTMGLWQFTLPDMMIFSDTISTNYMHRLMFHELSHVVHYDKAGNDYWKKFVANIIHNLGYGNGTSHSDYIGVGEMWGNYMEYVAFNYYWNTIRGLGSLSAVPDSGVWYRPDLLKRVVDTVPTLTPWVIYDCLVPTDTNFTELKKEIKNRISDMYYSRVDAVFSPLFE